MFRRWIDRNREELRKRFPKIESFFTRRGVFDYSTSTFAIGTAHEFILISVVSFRFVPFGQGNINGSLLHWQGTPFTY